MMSNPACPICEKPVAERNINAHIDSGCQDYIQSEESQSKSQPLPTSTQTPGKRVANFFSRSTPSKQHEYASSPAAANTHAEPPPSTLPKPITTTSWSQGSNGTASSFTKPQADTTDSAEPRKRSAETIVEEGNVTEPGQGPAKRVKVNHLEKAAPLAERSRPRSLDEVCGQDLVGSEGVLRGLIEVCTFDTRQHTRVALCANGLTGRKSAINDPLGLTRIRQNHNRTSDCLSSWYTLRGSQQRQHGSRRMQEALRTGPK